MTSLEIRNEINYLKKTQKNLKRVVLCNGVIYNLKQYLLSSDKSNILYREDLKTLYARISELLNKVPYLTTYKGIKIIYNTEIDSIIEYVIMKKNSKIKYYICVGESEIRLRTYLFDKGLKNQYDRIKHYLSTNKIIEYYIDGGKRVYSENQIISLVKEFNTKNKNNNIDSAKPYRTIEISIEAIREKFNLDKETEIKIIEQ